MARRAAVLSFMLAIGGAAVPAAAQDSELIGYTAVVRNGAAGVLVFNEDCDNAFPGVGAHFCTSGDFIRGNLPTRPADPAANATNWIAPSAVGTVVAGTVVTVIDQSGKTGTPANLTCDGWASAAATVTAGRQQRRPQHRLLRAIGALTLRAGRRHRGSDEDSPLRPHALLGGRGGPPSSLSAAEPGPISY